MPDERFAWPLDASGPQIVVQLPRGAEAYEQHWVLLAFEGQGCRVTTTPDDENELRGSAALVRGSFLSVPTASCLLVDQQAEEISRAELRAAVRRAVAPATSSSGAGSPSLGASGPSLNVLPDSFADRFESVSHGDSANSVPVAGRALLLGAPAVWVTLCWMVPTRQTPGVPRWRRAMLTRASVLCCWMVRSQRVGGFCTRVHSLDPVGRKGLDQVYKPLCNYAEEAAPTPKPPPACGVSKGSLRALQMDGRAPALQLDAEARRCQVSFELPLDADLVRRRQCLHPLSGGRPSKEKGSSVRIVASR